MAIRKEPGITEYICTYCGQKVQKTRGKEDLFLGIVPENQKIKTVI